MGLLLVLGIGIALVAGTASLGQMGVLGQETGVYDIALVIVFRPDRRRRTRSPFSFATDFRGLDQGFQLGIVRMADDA